MRRRDTPKTVAAPADHGSVAINRMPSLLLVLAGSMFFEGYDSLLFSQLLPTLRAEFGFGRAVAGQLLALINSGSFLAFILLRMADTRGRRPMLLVATCGYTLCTAAGAVAPNIWVLAGVQFLARACQTADFALAALIASELVSAQRRGLSVGLLAASSTLGSIVCAGSVPLLLKTDLGYRAAFLAALPGLLILLWARRLLPETPRFAALKRNRERLLDRPDWGSWPALWRSRYRRRVLQVGSLWMLAQAAGTSSVAFWKDHAVTELGFAELAAGKTISIAALVALPMVFGTAPLLDVLGRRVTALAVFGIGASSIVASYSLRDPRLLTLALIGGMYASAAYFQVLNAWTSELFPTHMRGTTFAWCANVLGRCSYVATPLLVGLAAERVGWSQAIIPTAACYLLCAMLSWRWMPETRGRELEQTARLPS